MNFAGQYKLSKVRHMNEDESAIVYMDVEKVLAMKTDEFERRELQRDMDTLLSVAENGCMSFLLPLPPDVPEEEIKKAGMEIIDGMVKTRDEEGKIENGALYMHDKHMFLTGEEWVKISTDVEGELDLVTMYYKKV